jgi:AcrR family transcriptional regulator
MSTGYALKREERKAETRRALIEAAAELFATKGIDATSIDEVAAAVGLTKGAVYAHFPSKRQLVEEALDAAGAAVGGDELLDPSSSLAQRVTNVGTEAAKLLEIIDQRTMMLHLEYLLFVMRNGGRQRSAVREMRRNRAKSGLDFEKAADERGEPLLIEGMQLSALLEAVGHGLAIALAVDPRAFTAESAERFFAALGYGLDSPDAVNALLSNRPST